MKEEPSVSESNLFDYANSAEGDPKIKAAQYASSTIQTLLAKKAPT